MKPTDLATTSVADTYLSLLASRGVDYLFANAGTDFAPLIDWAVVGGGSHMQRKMRPEWAYDLIYWLDIVGIPTFFKQWGDLSVNPNPGDPTARENGGYAKGGRMIDEQTLSLFPKVI